MKRLILLVLTLLPTAALAQVAPLPEPETLSLFAIGAAAFFLAGKARK